MKRKIFLGLSLVLSIIVFAGNNSVSASCSCGTGYTYNTGLNVCEELSCTYQTATIDVNWISTADERIWFTVQTTDGQPAEVNYEFDNVSVTTDCIFNPFTATQVFDNLVLPAGQISGYVTDSTFSNTFIDIGWPCRIATTIGINGTPQPTPQQGPTPLSCVVNNTQPPTCSSCSNPVCPSGYTLTGDTNSDRIPNCIENVCSGGAPSAFTPVIITNNGGWPDYTIDARVPTSVDITASIDCTYTPAGNITYNLDTSDNVNCGNVLGGAPNCRSGEIDQGSYPNLNCSTVYNITVTSGTMIATDGFMYQWNGGSNQYDPIPVCQNQNATCGTGCTANWTCPSGWNLTGDTNGNSIPNCINPGVTAALDTVGFIGGMCNGTAGADCPQIFPCACDTGAGQECSTSNYSSAHWGGAPQQCQDIVGTIGSPYTIYYYNVSAGGNIDATDTNNCDGSCLTEAPTVCDINDPLMAGVCYIPGGFGSTLSINNGFVGVNTASPAYPLDVDGTIRAGGLYRLSDVRFKSSITKIDNALEKIRAINGYSFTWKDSGQPDLGVLAQEIEKVFADAVATDKDGKKSVQYSALIAPILEALDELSTQIDAMATEKYKAQSHRLDAIEMRIK